MPRTYDMSKRAQQAAQTTSRIIAATERLLTQQSLEEVTLQRIADHAETTVQTVLRHMGTREGCLKAVAEHVAQRIEEHRGGSNTGDMEKAISDLIAHYEADGELILNLLAQEFGSDPYAREITEQGRNYHRNWVKRCLASEQMQHDQNHIDALVAATDIYIWKLLRLDLGRSSNEVQRTILTMVNKLVEVP